MLLIGFGLVLAVIAPLVVPAFIELFYSMFTGKELLTLSDIDKKLVFWAFGLTGAVSAGWGITVLVIGYQLTKESNETLWLAIDLGIMMWFLSDSLISVLMGAYFNIVFNLGFLFLFLIPILGNYFTKSKNTTNGS